MCRPIDSSFSDHGALDGGAEMLFACVSLISNDTFYDLALASDAPKTEEWLENSHVFFSETFAQNTTSYSINEEIVRPLAQPNGIINGLVCEGNKNYSTKISSPSGPGIKRIESFDCCSRVPVTLPTGYANHTERQSATSDYRLQMSHKNTCHSTPKEQVALLENNIDVTDTEISLLYNILINNLEQKKTADCGLTGEREQIGRNSRKCYGDNNSTSDCVLETDGTCFPPVLPASTSSSNCGNDHGDDVPNESKNIRLCKYEGCRKRCRSSGRCISHGGGRRCTFDGCGKSSQGGDLCIRHGGGKRCSVKDCGKAAQSRFLCKAHGGGPRCQYEGCYRGSQGGGFCRSHGGGKRCMEYGCNKGTQRGFYCAVHGGSRLCEYPGCTRNDRGGGLCATHGGGKRCQFKNCSNPCRRKSLCSVHLRQQAHPPVIANEVSSTVHLTLHQ